MPTPQFEKLIIDLSGSGGLVNRFYGDYPYSVGHPELAIYGADNQYASGIVNPIAKYGYLSPASTTYISVNSEADSTANVVAATEVDEVNQFGFFYDYKTKLRRIITLQENTFTATPISIASTIGTDLQFYTVNGIRHLFFAYKTATAADIGVWNLTGLTGTGVNGTSGFLKYDTQTGVWAVGETVTGGTSGGIGIVQSDKDRGTTGTLLLRNWNGIAFQSGETLTGSIAGSARANGGISSVYQAFLSVEPTNNFTLGHNFIRMIPADNGYMYILDGSAVHKFDGTTAGGAMGTASANVLLFPSEYVLTDSIDLRGRLWITLLRSSRDIYTPTSNPILSDYCGVYVWDRKTTGTSTEDFIEVSGVREIRVIVAFQGAPTVFTVSSTGYTQIRMWNGNEFKVVKELGAEAYPRFHDSVFISGDMMTWLGNDGKWYFYGKITPESNNGLYIVGDLTTEITAGSTFRNSGAILMVGNAVAGGTGENILPEVYYASFLDSTNAKILKWFPHAFVPAGVAQKAATGSYKNIAKALPKLSIVHNITIFYPPIGSAGTTTLMNVDIYFNQSTTAWNASSIAVTQTDAQRSYKSIPVNAHGVNFIQLGVSYPASTNISAIPTPSYALIEYEPTGKIQ